MQLELVDIAAESRRMGKERLALRCTPALRRFLADAAAAGLRPGHAVRLAVERELVLADVHLFALDVEAARSLLSVTARGARPSRPLGGEQARYVRELVVARPVDAPEHGDTLAVDLPERLITRFRELSRPPAFDAATVGDMIAWELAGAFEGRSMGEWALAALVTARRV